MRKQSLALLVVYSALCALQVRAAVPEADLSDSSDYPGMARISGSVIVGYDSRDYDAASFITGFDADERRLEEVEVEGERGRWIYLAPEGRAGLGLLRNYEAILAKQGQVQTIYSCRNEDCPGNLGEFVFNANNSFRTSFGSDSQYLYSNSYYYLDQHYLYATVSGADEQLHVSIYLATQSDRNHSVNSALQGRTLIHLEVIKAESFEATIEQVSAETMSESIEETGHIALYGIFFDTDSDRLKSESAGTLNEIADLLTSDPRLSLYVVGHTDTVGEVEYNRDLSQRRASAVVESLVDEHGVHRSRLVPLGAGLMAPVASNETEEGRALNRRVVLVKR